MRQEAQHQARGAYPAVVGLAIVAVLIGWSGIVSPAPASGQDAGEAVMVAAGAWALDRVPGSAGRLDPHRSGAGKDGERVKRVARALGVGLAPLDEVRECRDVMDPASCTLSVDRLLAIGAPRIDGGEARVKVYAWYRSSSPTQPVTQQSWELRLARADGGWRVISGG